MARLAFMARFLGRDDPTIEIRSAEAEQAAVDAIDARVKETLTKKTTLDARREELQAALEALAQERKSLLSILTSDPDSTQAQLDALASRRTRIEGQLRDAADAVDVASAELAALATQRTVAERARDEAELQALALELQTLGADLDQHFAAGADRLRHFNDVDQRASALAHRVREPEGRYLGDRLVSAISFHLMPVLLSLIGTRCELTVTDERRRLDFKAASLRPFTLTTEGDTND